MNYDKSVKKRRWSHHRNQINRYLFRISDVSWYVFTACWLPAYVGQGLESNLEKMCGEFQIIIDLSDIHHGFTLFYDISWFMIISNHIMYSSLYAGFYHFLESSLIFNALSYFTMDWFVKMDLEPFEQFGLREIWFFIQLILKSLDHF